MTCINRSFFNLPLLSFSLPPSLPIRPFCLSLLLLSLSLPLPHSLFFLPLFLLLFLPLPLSLFFLPLYLLLSLFFSLSSLSLSLIFLSYLVLYLRLSFTFCVPASVFLFSRVKMRRISDQFFLLIYSSKKNLNTEE